MPETESKPPKKAAAKKATPAEAAAAEALQDGDVLLDFRGEKFLIPAQLRGSFNVAMAIASGNEHQMIYEMVRPEDRPKLFTVAKTGESFLDVATEFFVALGEATGEGNS